jgi:hypothetical protein
LRRARQAGELPGAGLAHAGTPRGAGRPAAVPAEGLDRSAARMRRSPKRRAPRGPSPRSRWPRSTA